MKLTVPFYSSEPTPSHPGGIHCVENSLRMILNFFEPIRDYSLKEIENITGKQPEKGSWSFRWSIWFVDHGYEVKHYTTFDFDAFEQNGIDYIRNKYGDEVADWQAANSNIEEARQLTAEYVSKIEVIKKQPTVEDISDAFENGYLVKASVNQKLLYGQEGYTGHSVVVTGLDDKNIWFHDPGLPAFENKSVNFELFQKAMDSLGGEMDAIKKLF